MAFNKKPNISSSSKKPKEFEMLVDAFKSLPSVGTKNAIKYAYHIIKLDQYYVDEFAKRLKEAKTNLNYCKYCHNLTNQEFCQICLNSNRTNTLYIVENISDLDKIEELHIHHGYYHVLHGEINPKKGITRDQIFIDDILDHIDKFNIKEVLIATSLSVSGEMTAEYIRNMLSHRDDINVYRIGFGLPNNASIDYSDEQTLKFALMNKRKIN